jgi:hypothetical protein
MNLTYITILVLASLIFVLAGITGVLYWQQTRMIQHIQSLSIVVSTLVNPPVPPPEPEPESEPEPEVEREEEQTVDVPVEDDDRVSVEHVTAPPPTATTPDELDVDELQSKTKAQLHKLLTDKGIPYAKSDNKTQLIELLKATA